MATDSGSPSPTAVWADDDLDRQLTLAFQRGEKDAYEAIHYRYAARVESLCRRMLGNPDDAKDAAQETFLRTYRALARFNGRYRVGAWITRIATNVCLDHLRARARREAMPAERIELQPRGFDETADPEIVYIRRAEGRKVGRLLASLPPRHRAAIVLRDFEGLSYEDVATAMQITESQVKALLHRARKSFRRSWSSGRLAGLVSLRWLRRVQDGARDHVGQGVSATPGADIATSVSNFVASCPTLHQSGQLLSERAAAVVTTVALSTAAVTGMAASLPGSDARPRQATRVAEATAAGPSAGDEGRSIETQSSAEERASRADASTTDESTTDEPMTEEPAPTTEESETPTAEAEPPPPSEPPASEEPPPSEPPAYDQSPAYEEQPAYEGQPAYYEEQPAYYEEQPADDQPPASDEQPAHDESPPASEDTDPSLDEPPASSDPPPPDPQPAAAEEPPPAGT